MITIAVGSEVKALIGRVRSAPAAFSTLTVCSPFIGEEEARELAALMMGADLVGCGVHVITTPQGARLLDRLLPRSSTLAARRIRIRGRLHAKFYLAASRRARATEVIVTSANLTAGGLRHNFELGIRANNSSDAGAQLIDEITYFAQRLAARL